MAVICAVLLVTVAALFVLLMRSKDAHLRTALHALGLVSKLETTLKANTDTLQENTEALEEMARASGKGGRQRNLVAVKASSGQEGQP